MVKPHTNLGALLFLGALAAGALLLYQRFRPHDPAQLYVNRLRIQAATQETEKQETKKEE